MAEADYGKKARNTSPFSQIALIKIFFQCLGKGAGSGVSQKNMRPKAGLSGGGRLSPVLKTGTYEMVLQSPLHRQDQAGKQAGKNPLPGKEDVIHA